MYRAGGGRGDDNPATTPAGGGGGGGGTTSSSSMISDSGYSHIDSWLNTDTFDISARLARIANLPPPLDSGGNSGAVAAPSSTTPTTNSHPTPQPPPPPPPPPPQRRCSSRNKSTSSMARTCLHQPSTASTYPPSLLYSSTNTPTESSISTDLANHLNHVPLLTEGPDGILELQSPHPPPPAFECPFWFLTCSYISPSQTEWLTHTLSHFRGEEPPRSVQCPLCAEFSYTGSNGWEAWHLRMEHVAWHHLLGHSLRTSRPDFHLFQHLWQKRLIDDQDLKELKGGNHNLLRVPANFVETGGNRRGRERRGQRRQHVGRVRPL